MMQFPAPYQEETLAFLVKDELREKFSSWDSIAAAGRVKTGTPDVPYFIAKLRERLPEEELVPISGDRDFFEATRQFEVMLMTAERGSILTLLYPEYTVVVPEPGTIKAPLAYPIARHDEWWRTFLDTWIELQRRIGTIDLLYRHRILV